METGRLLDCNDISTHFSHRKSHIISFVVHSRFNMIFNYMHLKETWNSWHMFFFGDPTFHQDFTTSLPSINWLFPVISWKAFRLLLPGFFLGSSGGLAPPGEAATIRWEKTLEPGSQVSATIFWNMMLVTCSGAFKPNFSRKKVFSATRFDIWESWIT